MGCYCKGHVNGSGVVAAGRVFFPSYRISNIDSLPPKLFLTSEYPNIAILRFRTHWDPKYMRRHGTAVQVALQHAGAVAPFGLFDASADTTNSWLAVQSSDPLR